MEILFYYSYTVLKFRYFVFLSWHVLPDITNIVAMWGLPAQTWGMLTSITPHCSQPRASSSVSAVRAWRHRHKNLLCIIVQLACMYLAIKANIGSCDESCGIIAITADCPCWKGFLQLYVVSYGSGMVQGFFSRCSNFTICFIIKRQQLLGWFVHQTRFAGLCKPLHYE